jgi:hypothetical protein
MELVVDLSTAAVGLRDGEEMERFAVRALTGHPGDGRENGALGALAAALSVHEAGLVEPGGDVLVPITAVRRLAREAAAEQSRTLGPDWESGFSAMLGLADGKGWIDNGDSIRAHVEWGD